MSVHLQPRDLILLEELGEYGVLDTATLNVRHWPAAETPRACQQRLRVLADAGLIRKTNLVVAVGRGINRGGGSLPAVYSLSPRGADYVEHETGRKPRRIAHDDLAPATILHRLETVQARLAIDDACRKCDLPQPTWILEQDSYPKATPSDPLDRRQILYERFTLDDGSETSCRPDASSLLHIPKPSRPDVWDALVVYWEIDRGSSSSQREKDKILGYEALNQSHRYAEHWPAASEATVRVFYVCPSMDRIKSVSQHVRGRPAAALYRFALRSDLVPTHVLTGPVWHDADGKTYRILRQAT